MKLSRLIALISSLSVSTSTLASQCDVNFNYGVVIHPDHVRILDKSKTLVQINGDTQLFVKGREIELSPEQQQAMQQFSLGIRQQIPEIVSIAIDSVEVGLKAVNKIIGGITGENSAAQQKIQENFNELQERLHKRFNQTDQNYFIAPQDLDDFDQIFAGEFEQEIEEIISSSLGSILSAVGAAISNSDEGNFEQRIDAIGERMETIGEDIELEIDSHVGQLTAKTQKFCDDLTTLDRIESKMHQSIPELNVFDLIQTDQKNSVQ